MEKTIIDNFLPKKEFENIADKLLSVDLPWYYNNNVLGDYPNKTQEDYYNNESFQFVHTIYSDCRPQSYLFDDVIRPVLFSKIMPEGSVLWRIKANLIARDHNHRTSGFHNDAYLDNGEPANNITTALLYINDSNGYTLFKDGSKCKCKSNRFVYFNNSIVHSSVSQTDKKRRVVLNFNYTTP